MTIQNLRTQIRRKGDFVDVGIAGVMLTYLAAAFGAETNYTKGTNFKEKTGKKKGEISVGGISFVCYYTHTILW